MGKVTAEQITSVNSKCKNGWRFDAFYFADFGKKTLIKQVRLDKQNFLQFDLRYNSNNQIELHSSKYFHETENSLPRTEGQGKKIILDNTTAKRRSVGNLIALTETLTEEKLMELEKQSTQVRHIGLAEHQ